MRQHIQYKLASLAFRALSGLAPDYLAGDCQLVAVVQHLYILLFVSIGSQMLQCTEVDVPKSSIFWPVCVPKSYDLCSETVLDMYRSSLYRCTEVGTHDVPKWSCTDLALPPSVGFCATSEQHFRRSILRGCRSACMERAAFQST